MKFMINFNAIDVSLNLLIKQYAYNLNHSLNLLYQNDLQEHFT